MILIPLGTNGFFPSYGRHTACYLLMPDPETAILLDAGTGVARLLEPEIKKRLEPVGELHIVLSHYHLDHVCGLFYLTGVWPRRKVVIHAPGSPLVDAEPIKALEKLLSPPLYPMSLWDLPVEVSEVIGPKKEIAGLRFRFQRQKHPGGSVGMRVEDTLAYVTDTVADPATADFVKGVRFLMHETWLTDEEAEKSVEADGVPAREKHSSAGAVAEIAARAGVGRVAPIHHAPWRTSEELFLLARSVEEKSGIPVVVLEEGKEYLLFQEGKE
ncbi:beta-lactamase domain protein [Ammonifex degensii KC4]|uniref:Beta-lactamase domain protein n=1 Tax=Ammonifex degensii (strain DSM 10501 / KC4) TaxID=429009 RepID=C9RC70_AMMDK|nr:MBL fold metallo-hydrolase [Ammonifex degensii]ACX51847.1 beta-lactamase domain protein [Ammonifex degensii KC4]